MHKLKNRSPLPVEDIYAEHYAESGIPMSEFARIWGTIEGVLHVRPGTLRPEDTFDDLCGWHPGLQNFLPIFTDVDELAELIDSFPYGPARTGPARPQHDEVMNSIDDLVRGIAGRMPR